MINNSRLIPLRNLIFALILLFVGSTTVQAQNNNLTVKAGQPNYIAVNQVNKSRTFNIYDGNVHLEYLDHIGQSSQLSLEIYNWKAELLGIYPMDKSLGSNHYSFNLLDMGIRFLKDDVYRCALMDENRTKFEWNLKCAEKPTDIKPLASIRVKPIQVGCSSKKGNGVSLIEFYGTVTNGRGPFTLNWYVLNEAKSQFLYQPKEEVLQETTTISMIRVDQSPVYNVMLLVTDACGNTGKQMIQVSCSSTRKKVNTLIVEPFDNLQTIQPTRN